MKCTRCGKLNTDKSAFCSECGAKIQQSSDTAQFRCKGCNGLLELNMDNPIMVCPYCGSKELLKENDTVMIQRIKSQTHKDIELERLKMEEERARRQAEWIKEQEMKERLQKFKKGGFSKVIILSFLMCLLASVLSFKFGQILRGIISVIQMCAFATAWLMGMQFLKEKKAELHVLIAVIGFLLIIPFLGVNGKYTEKYVWPREGINTELPQPESKRGHIVEQDDDIFEILIFKVSQEDFRSYIRECEDVGFEIDVTKENNEFNAYNEEGYGVNIEYNKNSEIMTIYLEAPKQWGRLRWPQSGIAQLLPIPNSTKGEVAWENEDGFLIYVAYTSFDEYNEYVDACRENGFYVDYRKGEDYYYADNVEGYSLSLDYEGNRVMSISIDGPVVTTDSAINNSENELTMEGTGTDEIENEESENNESNEETQMDDPAVNTDSVDNNPANNGIRPEFKEYMDSYEAYFDEYCEFMKNYNESDNPALMWTDYSRMMIRYSETMQKMEELGEEEMSQAELAYYIEVTTRINQKLLDLVSE